MGGESGAWELNSCGNRSATYVVREHKLTAPDFPHGPARHINVRGDRNRLLKLQLEQEREVRGKCIDFAGLRRFPIQSTTASCEAASFVSELRSHSASLAVLATRQKCRRRKETLLHHWKGEGERFFPSSPFPGYGAVAVWGGVEERRKQQLRGCQTLVEVSGSSPAETGHN